MEGFSLLFSTEEIYNQWYDRKNTLWEERNRDLNMERIAQAILERECEFPSQYLLCPCFDRPTAELRREIFQELYENPALVDALEQYIPILNDLVKNTQQMFDTQHPQQRQHRFLLSAWRYCVSWEALPPLLKNTSSQGLQALYTKADTLIKSEQWKGFHKECIELIENFNQIYTIDVDISYSEQTLRVHPAQAEDGIADTIAKYAKEAFGITIKTEFSIINSNPFVALEELLMEQRKATNPAIFEALDEFCAQYHSLSFHSTIDLKNQILFYTGYLKLVQKLEQKGNWFSVPTTSESGFYAEDGYDLSLAIKLEDATALVANAIDLDSGTLFVLSGANQGGKTTYLRSIGIIAYLACNGCMIPARSGKIPFFDEIFTHFNRPETVGYKKGRLGEEIDRIKEILPRVTEKSLILFNECFASTRRVDGVELSLHLLNSLFKQGCMGGFVTHYYEIASMDSRLKSLVAEMEQGSRSHKIIECSPDGLAYAQDIAKKCGVTLAQLEELIHETS